MMEIFGYFGRKVIRAVNDVAELSALARILLVKAFRPEKSGRALMRREIMNQIYFTAVQALGIVLPVALLIGTGILFMASQVSIQYDLGKIMVVLVVRESGPMITALVVILRSATAVAVEMGYMKELGELDAVEMGGMDPVRLFLLPRLMGITSAILCLFVVFDLAAISGGYAVVWLGTRLPLENLFGHVAGAITTTDILVGLIKAVVFGALISVVAIHRGLSGKAGMTQVPKKASGSAVHCFLYCLLANIFISVLFYMEPVTF